MKIIDEKGRLFGKINVIDFLVILFLFFLAPMFYFGYKALTKKPPELIKEFIEIEIPCNLTKINPEILKLIAVGDRSVDKDSKQTGVITWIGESRPFVNKFYVDNTNSNNTVTIVDTVFKELPVKLKLITEIRGKVLYYNDKQVLIDSPLNFETSKYDVVAIPVVAEEEKEVKKEQWVRVKARFSELFPELSEMISSGHIEKDKDGRTIGILKEVISKKSSQLRLVGLKEKDFIFISDPYRNDITVAMDLLCTDKDGELFYKNYSVKVGNQISFSAHLYMVSGLIIDIKEIDDQKSN